MPTRPVRDVQLSAIPAVGEPRAIDAPRDEQLARPSRRRPPTARVIASLLATTCALLPWCGSAIAIDRSSSIASANEPAAALRQNVPVQPALGPIRRFGEPEPPPQPASPPLDVAASLDPFVFWLITTDGERRPIRQFAVDGETLVVWPVRPSTKGAANDTVRAPGSAPSPTRTAGGADSAAPASTDGAKDPDRESERMPLASCVAIVANRPVRAAAVGPRAEPAVELVDGQRFPGEPRATAKPFAWSHSWLGVQAIELERTRSIVLQPSSVAQTSRATSGTGLPEPGAEDLVLLANGDRVEGIIEEFGADVVVERANAGATTIPIGRIAALVLISPLEPPIGPRLWFDDGTVIDAVPTSSETAKPGLLAIRRIPRSPTKAAGVEPPTPTTAERTPLVETVVLRAFATSPSAILPLASVTLNEARPTGTLPTFAPNRPTTLPGQWPANLLPIVIGGATAVRYELPEATGRFVAEMRPEGANPRWTSFTVVVRSGDREVFRREVVPDPSTGALPREPLWINVPITSRALEIEVLEGERGPICDGIRLDYAMVIRPTKAAESGAAPRG